MSEEQNSPNGNVIEFPVKKAPTPQAQEIKAKGKVRDFRIRLFVALTGLSLSVFIVNGLFLSSSETQVAGNQSGRGLASVSDGVIEKRNIQWEHEMARALSRSGFRQLASIGKAPTLREELRFGELGHNLGQKYLMRFDQGRLVEIKFTPDVGLETAPKFFNDRKAFLHKYRELMPEGFSRPNVLNRQESGQRVYETYSLLNSDEESVGLAEFELDIYGRLLSCKISPAENS